MRKTTVEDVIIFKLNGVMEDNGNLVPIQSSDLPFDVKRVFYVYDVKDNDTRGMHAHYLTNLVLICLNGELEVICDDGKNRKKYLLDSPDKAIYIPEMIWDEQTYLSKETMMLAFASTSYDPTDYISDYEYFVKLKNV